jgi:hypothetical protein
MKGNYSTMKRNKLLHTIHIITEGSNSKISRKNYAEWKNANLKRIHDIWFRLYNILEIT